MIQSRSCDTARAKEMAMAKVMEKVPRRTNNHYRCSDSRYNQKGCRKHCGMCQAMVKVKAMAMGKEMVRAMELVPAMDPCRKSNQRNCPRNNKSQNSQGDNSKELAAVLVTAMDSQGKDLGLADSMELDLAWESLGLGLYQKESQRRTCHFQKDW